MATLESGRLSVGPRLGSGWQPGWLAAWVKIGGWQPEPRRHLTGSGHVPAQTSDGPPAAAATRRVMMKQRLHVWPSVGSGTFLHSEPTGSVHQ